MNLDEKYLIRDKKGKPLLYLNDRLIKKQNVSDENIQKIKYMI